MATITLWDASDLAKKAAVLLDTDTALFRELEKHTEGDHLEDPCTHPDIPAWQAVVEALEATVNHNGKTREYMRHGGDAYIVVGATQATDEFMKDHGFVWVSEKWCKDHTSQFSSVTSEKIFRAGDRVSMCKLWEDEIGWVSGGCWHSAPIRNYFKVL